MATNSPIASVLRQTVGLKLNAPANVTGNLGRCIGRHTGNAMEFAEYRDYVAGDDVRRLDWNVFARSGQLMIRQYEEEVDPRCDIVLDCSASMSIPENKSYFATGLAALFAVSSDNAGFSLSFWKAGDKWEKELKSEKPLEWKEMEYHSHTSPGESVYSFVSNFKRNGIRIVISDFLWSAEPSAFIRRISENGRRTILVRLNIMPEITEKDFGAVHICDPENGEQKDFILTKDIYEKYLQRHGNHCQMWNEAAAEAGAEILDLDEAALQDNWAINTLIKRGLLSYA